MACVAVRLEVVDPGFARVRRGARTACATVLSGLTPELATAAFGIANQLPITLFGGAACFFGALLVTDPCRSDRVHTFGWAAVAAAVVILVTVEVSRIAGDAVAGAAGLLTGHAPDRVAKALRRSLDRVMRCRTAVEGELSGALPPAFGQHDIEQLRVALYCAERGIQKVINQADDPRWIDMLPVDIARSIASALRVLANALRDSTDAQSLDAIAYELQSLRDPSTMRRPLQRQPMRHHTVRSDALWQF
ncbi:hypothetical protein [Mycobacterium sp. URHB0021]